MKYRMFYVLLLSLVIMQIIAPVAAQVEYGVRLDAGEYIRYAPPTGVVPSVGTIEIGFIVFENTTWMEILVIGNPGTSNAWLVKPGTPGVIRYRDTNQDNTTDVSFNLEPNKYYVARFEINDTVAKLYINDIYVATFTSQSGYAIYDLTMGDDDDEYIYYGFDAGGSLSLDYIDVDAVDESEGETWTLYDDLDDFSLVSDRLGGVIVDITDYVPQPETVTTTVTSTVTTTETVTVTNTTTVTETITNTTTVTETETFINTTTVTATLYDTVTATLHDTVYATSTVTNTVPYYVGSRSFPAPILLAVPLVLGILLIIIALLGGRRK